MRFTERARVRAAGGGPLNPVSGRPACAACIGQSRSIVADSATVARRWQADSIAEGTTFISSER